MGLEVINCGYATNDTGEEYLKNKIVKLYKDEDDENNEAVLYIKPMIRQKRPDFVLIDKKRGISIIEAKDWSFDYIAELSILEVKTINGNKISNPAGKALAYLNLLKGMLGLSIALLDRETGEIKFNICSSVAFPNMDENDLERLDYFFKQNFISCFPKNILRNIKLDELFNNKKSIEMEEHELKFIRGLINPEIKIVDTPKRISKNKKVEEYIKVLDYEQEKFAKRIINGHYIVTGIPGSGKTIMLLSRALFIAKEHPDWQILIVCYNKSLASKLKKKVDILSTDLNFEGVNINNIIITNFHKLLWSVCPMSREFGDKDFFMETWPQKALEYAVPRFDAVLIDEYQDFSDTIIKFCLACCKKHDEKENMFLAGDRLQSIYNPKETSWKSLGINIVGRSSLLKTSYRAGKNHILTALEFLKLDPKLEREVENFYEGDENVVATDYGDDIVFIDGFYDEIIRIIKNIINSGYKYKDILILCASNKSKEQIYNLMTYEMKLNCINEKDQISGEKMVITTYHSSKGLENKIAILTDFDRLYDRKVAYVGMTRASEHLFIHASDYDDFNFASEIREIVESKN